MEENSKIYQFLRTIYHITLKPIVQPVKTQITKKTNERIVNESRAAVASLKDTHKGERCFIIGNGPSLTAADLSRLKGEYSFAANRIYNIFDQTDWRPTYYCVQDWELMKKSKKEINREINTVKLVGIEASLRYPRISKAVYLNRLSEGSTPYPPKFSEDLANGYCDGYSVTYTCMQIAAYMGFKDIILLGIDHNYSVMVNENGELVTQQGVADHFSKNDSTDNLPHLDYSTAAYKAAKEYAKAHSIKIYNATRGGRLEVFERVDFDSLFQ